MGALEPPPKQGRPDLWVSLVLGLIVLVVILPWPTPETPGKEESVTFDCLASFPYAETKPETTFIDFGTNDRKHFLADDGLSLIDGVWEENGERYTYRVGFDQTRLELYFHEVQDREATLRLSPLSWEGGPEPTARVRLNGHEIASLELEINPRLRRFQTRSFGLPAEHQQPGINRLEIEWGITEKIGDVLPSQQIDLVASAWLLDLEIRAVGSPPPMPALGDISIEPDGARGLIMEPGVTAEYFLELPAGATLVFWPQVTGSRPADFRVAIEPAEGEGAIERSRVEPRSEERRRIDLSRWAGQIVRLGLSVYPADGSRVLDLGEALGTAWGHPRVIAPMPEASADRREPDLPDLSGHPVVVILCDAMRWDALSATGAPEGLTPNLDALAEESVVFDEAFSQASYTVTSIPSLMTGQYPQRHGILAGVDTLKEEHKKLPDDTPTLASGFRDRGYATGAIVSNMNAGSRYGNDVGFDLFRELGVEPDKAFFFEDPGVFPSHKITSAATDWLDDIDAASRPFFLYVHYFEPHAPYYPDPSFEEGVVGEYEGPYAQAELRDIHHMGVEMLTPGSAFDQEALEHLRELYHATTRSVDASIGELIDDLKRRGVYDEAMILVVSDHGEEFAEHGLLAHGEQTHDEGVRVPLVVKLPQDVPAAVGHRAGQVELVDVLPTLYELFRLGQRPSGAWGESFAARLIDAGAEGKRFTYAIALNEKSISIRSDDWRYLEWPSPKVHRRELYDLRADPAAQEDVLDEHPVVAGFLRTQMRIFFDLQRRLQNAEVSGEGFTDAELEALRKIGYTGGSPTGGKKNDDEDKDKDAEKKKGK